MVDLPKKITPCPIVESILEIRFSSALPDDAIFGILYNQFKSEYTEFKQLPILQLPAPLRAQDPALHYNAHYRTQKDVFVLQIGPRVISISNVDEYVGWDTFSEKIYDTYKQIDNSKVIDKIERVGLRYINILEGINIFKNSNFIISLKKSLINRKTSILTEMPVDKGVCILKATSDAEARLGGPKGKVVLGSVVDLDVIIDSNKFETIKQSIEHAHNIEKEIFFNILDAEFIKTLNPEY